MIYYRLLTTDNQVTPEIIDSLDEMLHNSWLAFLDEHPEFSDTEPTIVDGTEWKLLFPDDPIAGEKSYSRGWYIDDGKDEDASEV